MILMSAFNGIESMIETLYSEFDTDLSIYPKNGKSFSEDRVDLKKINAHPMVQNSSRALEEVIILKHEKKWVNANLLAVDSNFLEITKMKEHLVEDNPMMFISGENYYGIIGATLLDKLEGYIPKSGTEQLICYLPKKNIRIRPGKNPFNVEPIEIGGRFAFNKEINAEYLVVPLGLGQEFLDVDGRITSIMIDVKPGVRNEDAKAEIQKLVGSDFVVKTNYEKNELVYQTSKTEKLIVFGILIFIFVLAAFNLVASLTMLFVEKQENLKSMMSFGASRKFLFNLFFIEGMLISGLGIIIGLVFGYTICILQMKYGFLTMPNSGGQAFPIDISLSNSIVIVSMVVLLSIIFTVLPVKYLMKRNLASN